ncbi:MAG: sugar transferase [Elusimicrobia bacterium]|nr:sugar transferase [Elusimicrobiota bacterium]
MPSTKRYFIVLAGDAVAIFFSFAWVTLLRRWDEISARFLAEHAVLFLTLISLWLWVFHLCGLYEPRNWPRGQRGALPVAVATAFLLSSLGLYFASGFIKMPAPKIILVLATVLAWGMLEFWRTVLARLITSQTGGAGRLDADSGAVVIDRRLLAGHTINGYHESLRQAALKGLPVYSSSSLEALESGKIPVDDVTAEWLVERVLSPSYTRAFYVTIKRLTDLAVVTAAFIPAFAAALFVSAWIKIFLRGPVFYRQERVGKGGGAFMIWKFRTMRDDGAAISEKSRLTIKSDPRVPWTLRWIRQTHLDELPQLINIARGEMSFVGPRPEQVGITQELDESIAYYWIRHTAVPGLTGWAQVNMGYAGNMGDAKERFAYDLYYLANSSFSLDLAILVRTLRNIILAEGR